MIERSGAEEIALALRDNKTIVSIDLSENPIGDKGGLAIAEMLRVRKIEKKLFTFKKV